MLKTRKHGIMMVVKMIKNLQRLIRGMWYCRNDALHKDKQSQINKAHSLKYNLLIDKLFLQKRTIPTGLLAQADRKYFRRDMQVIKRMKLTRKIMMGKGCRINYTHMERGYTRLH